MTRTYTVYFNLDELAVFNTIDDALAYIETLVPVHPSNGRYWIG